MVTPIPQVSANQTKQSNLVGQLDLQTGRSAGVITGRVSPNASGPIPVGSSVKLDPANTGGGGAIPWFLPCAVGDVAFGSLAFTERQSDPGPGDMCEVTHNLGPAVWKVVDTAPVQPGQLLQDGVDGGQYVDVLASGKQRGLALDGGAVGTLIRMMTNPALS